MAGQLTIDTLKASSGVLSTQNGMTGIAKAWVQFAGSTATINSSFNVSSITRSSTGVYVVNITTALPSSSFAVNATASPAGGNLVYIAAYPTSTSTLNLYTWIAGVGSADFAYTSVSVFGA